MPRYAKTAPESKGPGIGVEHHLLALPRYAPDPGHTAMAKPGVHDFSLKKAIPSKVIHSSDQIELVHLSRREGETKSQASLT